MFVLKKREEKMMKSYALLTLMFVICSTGSLMSMEQGKKGRLNFTLDHFRRIKGYSAQNMAYDTLPEDFLDKNILTAVPLNEDDRKALDAGFNQAVEKQITVSVPYSLVDRESLVEEKFLATITPVIKRNKQHNFFVKVTEYDDK